MGLIFFSRRVERMWHSRSELSFWGDAIAFVNGLSSLFCVVVGPSYLRTKLFGISQVYSQNSHVFSFKI